jgi:choline kinase
VAGHGLDRLQAWLSGRPTTFPLHVCVNDEHVRRNNWYSLLVGLQWLADRGWDGAVVILNSDLCAAADWFERFLRHVRATAGDGGILAVDLERPLTDEAMKVDVRPTDGGEPRCVRIGKTEVERPSGEYVGMAAFGPGGWLRLLEVLRSFCDRPEQADAWYEAAIQVLMDREPVATWAVTDGRWTEIDDQFDLAEARRLMAQV